MRIISGYKKGKKLYSFKGYKIRPTSDKVKESVFNILGDVTGTQVLDLFCGSGTLGLEALSRGAASGTFIDKDSVAVDLVRKNIKVCEFKNYSQVIKCDVFNWIAKTAAKNKNNCNYNLVFADPPYKQGYVRKLLNDNQLIKLVDPMGLFIVECSEEEVDDVESTRWNKVKIKNYGNTVIALLQPDRSE